MKCFYHTDMDGLCSGAIVKKFYESELFRVILDEQEYIPINYKDDFPFDKIKYDEAVVIVDFSLQKEGDFERLLSITPNVTWIDHHITAIEKHENVANRIPGIRKDGTAACELTWNFFFPNVPVPHTVKLLADYDIWAFKYGDNTNYLQTGIRLYDTSVTSRDWNDWLDPAYYPSKEIDNGRLVIKYRDNNYAGLIKGWSFFADFEGYRAVCCNAGSVSSHLFQSVKEPYDIMMPFVFDGDKWTVSLYTTNPDIDVSKIAVKYGGGGHKKAAGFTTKTLPFQKLNDR